MIIVSKVHFFTILQVLKVFKPDFSPNLVFMLTYPSTYPTCKFELFKVTVYSLLMNYSYQIFGGFGLKI